MKRIALLTVCLMAVLLIVAGCPPKGPKVPYKPWGVATSFKYATESYSTATTDPGNNQVKFVFDWGDGKFDTSDLGNSGETLSVAHTWLTEGTFKVKALAINSKGKLSAGWSDELSVVVGPNDKPNAPTAIGGVDGGIKNQYLRFTTSATDPNSDDVSIIFYYDTTQRNKNSGWLGPVAGGTTVAFDSAKYSAAGTYYVVAYAKDTKGAISDPSPVKTITIAPMEISWMKQTPDGDAFYSSPAMSVTGTDTVIYVGCDNGYVYGYSAGTGGSKGSFQSFNEDGFSSSPAVSDGPYVYIADDGGWLYGLGPTLGLISHYPDNDTWVPGMSPFYSTPAVKGNALYIGRDDGFFYYFTINAGVLTYNQSYNTGADISSSPAISADGSRIVVGNDSGYVYCFDAALGFQWKRLLGAPVTSSPAITAGGIIYIGCDDQYLYALNLSDGSNAFAAVLTNDFITSSPVLDASNTAYVTTDDGTVYAVKDGAVLWFKQLPYGENVSATGCLAPDTTLIINTDDGSVYGVDVNPASAEPGRVLYRIEWPEPEFKAGGRKSASLASSITVGPANGMFYAGSTNGGFGAVRVDKPSFQTGSLPVTPWPKFHHDVQNSGWLH
jgi:outer membrane protein assembly factor BamB